MSFEVLSGAAPHLEMLWGRFEHPADLCLGHLSLSGSNAAPRHQKGQRTLKDESLTEFTGRQASSGTGDCSGSEEFWTININGYVLICFPDRLACCVSALEMSLY